MKLTCLFWTRTPSWPWLRGILSCHVGRDTSFYMMKLRTRRHRGILLLFDSCCLQMVCLIYQILHKCKWLVCTFHLFHELLILSIKIMAALGKHQRIGLRSIHLPSLENSVKLPTQDISLNGTVSIGFLHGGIQPRNMPKNIQVRHSELHSVFQWTCQSTLSLESQQFAAVSFWTHLFLEECFLTELLWFLVVDWPIVGGSVVQCCTFCVVLCFCVLVFNLLLWLLSFGQIWVSFVSELEITSNFKRPTRHSRGAGILAYRTMQYSYPSQKNP